MNYLFIEEQIFTRIVCSEKSECLYIRILSISRKIHAKELLRGAKVTKSSMRENNNKKNYILLYRLLFFVISYSKLLVCLSFSTIPISSILEH